MINAALNIITKKAINNYKESNDSNNLMLRVNKDKNPHTEIQVSFNKYPLTWLQRCQPNCPANVVESNAFGHR